MQHYLSQLLSDITHATANLPRPYVPPSGWALQEWLSPEEEDATAPVRELEEYTGIRKEQLPPAEMLTDEQITDLLKALNKLLEECNWHFVLHTYVPERIQYTAMRDYWDQPMKVKQWHMAFFEMCRPGTEHKTCALGEHCQCAFYAELFKDIVHEDLSPEEERRQPLDCEITHLRRRHGDDWMKYYPYHLDPEYDEDGNPYDYGASDWFNDDEEDEDDNWWRR
jgi:hypothetical protein